jgi:hypothetical protein
MVSLDPASVILPDAANTTLVPEAVDESVVFPDNV